MTQPNRLNRIGSNPDPARKKAGRVRLALFLLLNFAAPVTAVLANDCEPSLYGTRFQGPDDIADLMLINMATGVAVNEGSIGFERVSAIDIHPISGILYGIAERSGDDQMVLISIDRETGAGTEIAEITLQNASSDEHIAGMSFNNSGTLYAYGSSDQGVYTINISDGSNTRLGVNTTTFSGNGLAFSPGGVLYHSGAEPDADPIRGYLHTVNLGTGALTQVDILSYFFPFTFPLESDDPKVAAMEYAADPDVYYAILKNGSAEAFLTTMDVTTGAVTNIGNTEDRMDGIAYICEPLTVSIELEKHTNGVDADTGTGPEIVVGQPVQWEFIVTNTGETVLNNIQVTDNLLGAIGTCPETTLDPDESMTCMVTGTSVQGQYENIGDVIGTSPGGTDVTDTDPSRYLGVVRSINIEKATNGADADSAPGPSIVTGQPVTWTYLVTNTGETLLDPVVVTDSDLGAITCPQTSLIAGASMTCTAIGAATAGQYENTGTATGTPPAGSDAVDTDLSHYLGVTPSISIQKSTNGLDADTAPGPSIEVGQPVTWTYRVTNTGETVLNPVVVTDSVAGVNPACGATSLGVGQSMNCSAFGVATAGQYVNTGTATGTPPAGPAVMATDLSHYRGVTPAISIEKSTNGLDADSAPGPSIVTGQPVTWTYLVTNTGETDLDPVHVTDNVAGVDPSCPATTLAVGESMTCTASGVATAGQYANTGTAIGFPSESDPVSDSDPSHYLGVTPSIDIEKHTNGQDADSPTGPEIEVGQAVLWEYMVTNSGETTLDNIQVTDDLLGPITCPASMLVASDSMTCTAGGTATPGQYANIADVVGSPPAGPDVTDSDPSHYFGVAASITIEKATNGVDGDTPTGIAIAVGQPVTWTYEVTNTGNVPLNGIAVTDDQLGAIACPETTLAPAASMTCSIGGTAEAGQYANVGEVTGTPATGSAVTDSDPSHYLGVTASVTIQKTTNGQDSDLPPGQVIEVGQPVNWAYTVTNTSIVAVTEVTVTDSKGVVVTCPTDELAAAGEAGDSMVCTGSGTATLGQYENLGQVLVGAQLVNNDSSHYRGVVPSIALEKSTNGVNADSAPGPKIEVGQPVAWTYLVTNTGLVALDNVSVSDDQLGAVTCPQNTLAAGASMTCTANGTATEGQYANLGTASGTSPAGTTVEDDDPSHYQGVIPSIQIVKSTNGMNANSAPGPQIEVGQPVTWTYLVTNTGPVTLSSVAVSDDIIGPISCPKSTLTAGEIMTCIESGSAVPGQYANIGTVTAVSPAGSQVTDEDPSHYFGYANSITIEKHTNGEDADTGPGPQIEVGEAILWEYFVTNSGNTTLSDIEVTDDQGVIVSCPETSLAPGNSMTCTGTGTATSGAYQNTGTVTATPPAGNDVTDSDLSHYLGLVLEEVIFEDGFEVQ